jgi:hypothetical protein
LTVTNNGTCNSAASKVVKVYDFPGTASTPWGNSPVCQSSAGNLFMTDDVAFASSFLWSVNPPEAGTLTGTGDTVIFDVSATFSGTAEISVKVINPCGEGPASDVLPVTVNPLPAAAAMPSGPDSVNLNKVSETEFGVTPVQDAESYGWTIDPVAAGTISGNSVTGTVTWDKTYRGDAFITVKGTNSCGDGTVSDQKTVTLYAPVGINDQDNSGLRIYPNPTSGKLNIQFPSGSNGISLRIYNTLGTTVFTETNINSDIKFTKTIDLSGLNAGVYFFKVDLKDGSVIRKIVIEK